MKRRRWNHNQSSSLKKWKRIKTANKSSDHVDVQRFFLATWIACHRVNWHNFHLLQNGERRRRKKPTKILDYWQFLQPLNSFVSFAFHIFNFQFSLAYSWIHCMTITAKCNVQRTQYATQFPCNQFYYFLFTRGLFTIAVSDWMHALHLTKQVRLAVKLLLLWKLNKISKNEMKNDQCSKW